MGTSAKKSRKKHNHQWARPVYNVDWVLKIGIFLKMDAYMKGMRYFHCNPAIQAPVKFSTGPVLK